MTTKHMSLVDRLIREYELGSLPAMTGGDDEGFTAIESQADLDRIIGDRLKRERRKITDEVRKDFENEQEQADAKARGDLQKQLDAANEELETLRKEKADREARDLKASLAKKHGIPDDQVDRIQGTTEEEMEEDAKKFAAAFVKDSPDKDIGDRSVDGDKSRTKEEKSLAETFVFGQQR